MVTEHPELEKRFAKLIDIMEDMNKGFRPATNSSDNENEYKD